MNLRKFGGKKCSQNLRRHFRVANYPLRAFSSCEKTPINFNDAQATFRTMSLWTLIRSYTVYKLCSFHTLVKNAERLTSLSYTVFGTTVTNTFFRWTFFGHFVAGESTETIRPTIDGLHKNGIGSILDYAAENDTDDSAESANSDVQTLENATVQCRTYEYRDEERCDAQMQVFADAIRAVREVSPTGFAAIKLTALGNPILLERMSKAVRELHNLFSNFDTDMSGKISLEEFETMKSVYFSETSDAFEQFPVAKSLAKNGYIDYIDWTNAMRLEDLHLLTQHCKNKGPLSNAVLTEEERGLMQAMRCRSDTLAQLAKNLGVRLMIDAEHNKFQPAIDDMTLMLQKKYNKGDKPTIFNTYQMYLVDSYDRLCMDINRSSDHKNPAENYFFAAKLVRGAYLHHERERAAALNEPDPIHPSKEDTDKCYNEGIETCIQKMGLGEKVEIMVASHNQESTEIALAAMKEHGVFKFGGVYFGQLLGMADHLTFTLGNAGYNAYKCTFGFMFPISARTSLT